MAKFEVPVIYKGQCNFIVEAGSEEEATQIARRMFNNGDRPDELGNEWEKIDWIGDVSKVDPQNAE
jgi:hypothetical protein